MSYTIFYRAMYIRLGDGTYIPMIESGDNNVYDCDRNRRSREWTSCRWLHESEEQRKRYSLTEKEILDRAQAEIDRHVKEYTGREPAFGGNPYTKEQVLADLGFFNCIQVSGRRITSAACFYNFMKSGIRNAVTMEELRCGLRLSWYRKDGKYETDYAADEKELAEKWNKFQDEGITPWIGLSESEAEYAWQIVKNRTKTERKPKTLPEHPFVIEFLYGDSTKYVVQLTSRHLKFNDDNLYAHKYATEKAAKNACEKITSKRFNNVKEPKVIRI